MSAASYPFRRRRKRRLHGRRRCSAAGLAALARILRSFQCGGGPVSPLRADGFYWPARVALAGERELRALARCRIGRGSCGDFGRAAHLSNVELTIM